MPPLLLFMGSRAANGVILVTTKRGKGEKLTITYNGFMGKQKATNLPDKVGALDHMQHVERQLIKIPGLDTRLYRCAN